jgi:glutamate-5-semialdehyde dehydrogenase
MSVQHAIRDLGVQAKQASRELLHLTTRKKNTVIEAMADALENERNTILAANERDITQARANGLRPAALDRLLLTPARLQTMLRSMRDIAALPDPVGATISRWLRPNGLEIVKRRVPIGVIAIICESCPSVATAAAALCLKSSNAVIFRGGRDGAATITALIDTLVDGGRQKGMPTHALQQVRATGYDAVRELVQMEDCIDLAIPRGEEGLLRTVIESAHVPVLRHYKGVCHIYVDRSADLEMATSIVDNAKCQNPGACNAADTLLVHADIAAAFLPPLVTRLIARNVDLRGDESVRQLAPIATPVVDRDWYTEHVGCVLCIRIVPSADAAIAHINTCGTHHADAIVAADENMQRQFTQEVDSATVYVNASTRFTDGESFGMGAEIGISADKLLARGPVGLEELTTAKYVIHGNGQIRQ